MGMLVPPEKHPSVQGWHEKVHLPIPGAKQIRTWKEHEETMIPTPGDFPAPFALKCHGLGKEPRIKSIFLIISFISERDGCRKRIPDPHHAISLGPPNGSLLRNRESAVSVAELPVGNQTWHAWLTCQIDDRCWC